MRSPKNCVSSFTYGVSPQPPHAPENSNNGSKSCEPLIVSALIFERSASGSERKKSKFARSRSHTGIFGVILIALRSAFSLSLAGQAATHRPQPVQSSGATWTMNFQPGNSLPLYSVDWNSAGPFANTAGSATFVRIAACGHTNEHWPHWMQSLESQTGMSWAMLRFSYCVVGRRERAVGAVGKSTHRQIGRPDWRPSRPIRS